MISWFLPSSQTKTHCINSWTSGACLFEPHSVFYVLFLLVALHPFTGIKQVIYLWKAAVNTQLSHVDHCLILAMVLKVFHLKFVQCSSWTSCCFHVELLWCIFVFNFPINFVSVTQMIFSLYKPLSQYIFWLSPTEDLNLQKWYSCRFEVN